MRKPLQTKFARAVRSPRPSRGTSFVRKCSKCDADLSPYIIALQPVCKVFQFCPSCGTELGYYITIEAGKKQVLALKTEDH